MKCRGINSDGSSCAKTNLIRTHIIPAAFAGQMKPQNRPLTIISTSTVQSTQHGEYDPQIPCSACDQKLGCYDKYAVELIRRYSDERIIQGDRFTMLNVDGDKLAKFALACLWRASISTRPKVENVRLGPFESKASQVLFGASHFSNSKLKNKWLTDNAKRNRFRIAG